MKALLRVGLIFPVESQPLVDAGLLVGNDKIQAVGPYTKLAKKYSRYRQIDLSQWVGIPGFVNAHCHLELTGLKRKIHWHGDFADWIRQILRYKIQWKRADFISQIDQGLKQLVQTGCTTIGDHSTLGYSWKRMKKMKVRGVSYFEIVMFDPAQAPKIKKQVNLFLKGKDPLVSKGIAVHSPYSVATNLIEWSGRKRHLPLSVHISELREELDFIARDNPHNPFRQLLEQRGMWLESWKAPRKTPVAYLHDLSLKKYSAIHFNYPRADDINLHRKGKNHIVYCPLSHAYFKHPRWPMLKYRRANLPIALGTDSCASNHTLDMRAEMNHVRQQFKSLKNEDILHMATLGGAQALGLGKQVGSLRKNKKADLTFFKTSLDPQKALQNIVSKKLSIKAVMCNGLWLKKP